MENMKDFVVTLFLNNDGQKAFKTATKIIDVVAEGQYQITKEYINNMYFPDVLFDDYSVAPSFKNAKIGDVFVVITPDDNKRHIASIVREYDNYNRNISLADMYNEYTIWNIRPDGVEATHSKYKARVEIATEVEIDFYNKNKDASVAYQNMIKKLGVEACNSYGDEDDEIYINRPEWLTHETISKINEILEKAESEWGEEWHV